MFYCPNCNNIYDIARTSGQTGGNDHEFNFPTSDSLSNQTGGEKYYTVVEKIINDKTITKKDVEDININDFIKSTDYKKLTSEQKEKVYNKIQDLLPKSKKKIIIEKPEEIDEGNLAFFVCNNCGYSVQIKEETRIFSRTADDLSQSYVAGDYQNMLYSNILPKTRKYVCPNKNCESYKNPALREAIFFRKNNSYEVVHICTACKTIF